MRKLFRILFAIPCWVLLQSAGTFAFTLFFIIPSVGFATGVGYFITYLGTGDKNKLRESKESFKMLFTMFGGTLVTYSWIQTGKFDMDNFGMTHLQKEDEGT